MSCRWHASRNVTASLEIAATSGGVWFSRPITLSESSLCMYELCIPPQTPVVASPSQSLQYVYLSSVDSCILWTHCCCYPAPQSLGSAGHTSYFSSAVNSGYCCSSLRGVIGELLIEQLFKQVKMASNTTVHARVISFCSSHYTLLLGGGVVPWPCLLYTSPSPRDATLSRMPSSA